LTPSSEGFYKTMHRYKREYGVDEHENWFLH